MSRLGPRARTILDDGFAAGEPTGADRARVRAAIARGVAASAVASTAVAASSKTAAAASAASGAGAGGVAATTVAASGAGVSLVTKVVAVVALVSAAGVGIAVVRHERAPVPALDSHGESAGAASARRPAAASAYAVPPSVPTVVTEPPTPEAVASAGSNEGVRAPKAKRPTRAIAEPPPTAPPAESSSLAEQLDLLRQAQVALREGDPATALARLDDHARRFRTSPLAEERAADRVIALCDLGRTSEARSDAAQFLVTYPGSPHAARVRAVCPAD